MTEIKHIFKKIHLQIGTLKNYCSGVSQTKHHEDGNKATTTYVFYYLYYYKQN